MGLHLSLLSADFCRLLKNSQGLWDLPLPKVWEQLWQPEPFGMYWIPPALQITLLTCPSSLSELELP